MIARRRVDFPDPTVPTTAVTVPGRIVRSTWWMPWEFPV
jgi:hypothetical protein